MPCKKCHWSSDVERDERVRAEEDNRQRRLPTLTEAIAAQFACTACGGFGMDHRCKESCEQCAPTPQAQSGMRTERITLEVTHDDNDGHIQFRNWDQMLFGEQNGVRLPGESVRVVEEGVHGWKDMAASLSADVLKLTAERDAAIRERDRWCAQSGIHEEAANHATARTNAAVIRVGEVMLERDAAIRERDESRKSWLRSEESGTRLLAERNAALDAADGLRKRVAELQAEVKELAAEREAFRRECELRTHQLITCGVAADHQNPDLSRRKSDYGGPWNTDQAERVRKLRDERDALQARVAELEAASGGGEQEPVAWGVRNPKDLLKCGEGPVWSVRATKEIAERAFPASEGWIHFPLFDAPPPPRGWLTGEERDGLNEVQDFLLREGHDSDEVIESLLARSTPPEVVHPDCHFDEFSGCSAVHAWNICAADFRKALAAAGVAVKEVTS